LAIAALDIMPAAIEPPAIPAEVNPTAVKTTGAAATIAAPPRSPPPTQIKVFRSPFLCLCHQIIQISSISDTFFGQ